MTLHTNNASGSVPSEFIGGEHTFASVTDKISSVVLSGRTPRSWYFGVVISFALVMLLFWSIAWLFIRGIGVWGVNIPVGWGFAIVNFVWWIGIGHAGTLISAILLLLRQQWRNSINRFAEAMTLFAVACAAGLARTNVFSCQDFQHVVFVPTTASSFHDEAFFGGVLFK